MQKYAAQINKSKILFLREADDCGDAGAAGMKSHNAYPFVEKLSSLCRVKSMSYTLVGEVHHLKGQSINDILNSGSHFLPMTGVKIYSQKEAVIPKAGFIAVNKDQISYVENVYAD